MVQVSRRKILSLIPRVGIASFLSVQQAGAAVLPTNGVELFTVGPFGLGDRFNKAKGLADEYGPGNKETTTTLNSTHLFILDQRDDSYPKKLRFTKSTLYPMLVVGGPITYQWKDDPKSCSLTIKSLKAHINIEYSNPPRRNVTVALEFEIKGTDGQGGIECTYGTYFHVTYDLVGKFSLGSQR